MWLVFCNFSFFFWFKASKVMLIHVGFKMFQQKINLSKTEKTTKKKKKKIPIET